MTTMLLSSLSAAQADDYAYLNILKSDGTGITLPANGTTITFADGYLVAGSEKIALSELSVMRFSNWDTAINSVETDAETPDISEADAIYDLNGRQIPSGTQLKKGVYIVKKGNTTQKVQIR